MSDEHKSHKKESFTIKKLTIWKTISAILGILLIASILTGCFGSGSEGTSGSAADTQPAQARPSEPSQPSAAPTAVTGDLADDDEFLGPADAKVVVVEFSDFECPYCGIAEGNVELVSQFTAKNPDYVPAMPNVFKNYIQTGKVKLVFYNMPLEQLHPQVKPVHNAFLCANEQGKAQEFKELAFLNRKDWIGTDLPVKLKSYGKQLGLNQVQFDSCIDSNKYITQINNEVHYGSTLGVSGTPAFFIGKNFLSGAQDYNVFKSIIESKLSKLK